jgi:hypothetical protein
MNSCRSEKEMIINRNWWVCKRDSWACLCPQFHRIIEQKIMCDLFSHRPHFQSSLVHIVWKYSICDCLRYFTAQEIHCSIEIFSFCGESKLYDCWTHFCRNKLKATRLLSKLRCVSACLVYDISYGLLIVKFSLNCESTMFIGDTARRR